MVSMDPTPELFEIALAHHSAGRLLEAESAYRHALAVEPDLAAAHNNLGTLLQAQGRLQDALACYQRAIALTPQYADAHNNLATVFQEQGQWEAAIEGYQRTIAIDPGYARGHYNLGVALQACGRGEDAAAAFRRTLDLDSGYVDARLGLASVLLEQGNLDAAEAEYRQALRERPTLVAAYQALGALYQTQGKFAEAVDCYQQTLAIQPNDAEAHYRFAMALEAQQRLEAAVSQYRRAIELKPDFADAHYNLGVVLRKLGRLDDAVSAYEGAVRARGDYSLAYNNLANAYLAQGRGDDALRCYRNAVAMNPTGAMEHSNLLYALHFQSDCDHASIYEEHLAWARRHAEPLTAIAPAHAIDRALARRLRIGYISPHLCRHAVSFFIEPILASHDREHFEIFAYNDLRIDPDPTTARIRAAVEHWRDVGTKSDEEIVHMIRADRIDILVELTGHVGGNRLLVLARKPAPIQVTYLGYQNTTGMTAVDYRLTDQVADPPGEADRLHTEQLVRLHGSFFCYRPPEEAPPLTPLPALTSGGITFGSFNNFAKVTPQVVEAWMEILAGLEGSRLLVLAYRNGYVEQRLRQAARDRGLDPGRVELFDRQPVVDYLRLIARADIALDPFPFNGHTTTCDSIWMGVPVVMLQGDSYVSRFGTSVLANLDLPDWIAKSRDEYIRLAIEKASDLERLATLREELRPRMASSALLDFAGFTRKLEQAYCQMWAKRCAAT